MASPISQPNTYVESPKCLFFLGGVPYIYIYVYIFTSSTNHTHP